jgi:hypothetical protein
MLAQAGDNGNRTQRHLKPPRAALAGSQPTRTTPMAKDCLALAERIARVAPCTGAAAQAACGPITNNRRRWLSGSRP